MQGTGSAKNLSRSGQKRTGQGKHQIGPAKRRGGFRFTGGRSPYPARLIRSNPACRPPLPPLPIAPPQAYTICVVFLKLFERIYSPLTAGLVPAGPGRRAPECRRVKDRGLNTAYNENRIPVWGPHNWLTSGRDDCPNRPTSSPNARQRHHPAVRSVWNRTRPFFVCLSE